MAFMLVGIALLAMKIAEFGPVAQWGWGWIMLPFVLAAIWWAVADSIGLTQRRAIRKMEERKIKRRERDMEALGLNTRRERRVQAIRDAHRRAQSPEERAAVSPDANEDGRRRGP